MSFTSRDGITWEKESKNFYYATGQLLRMETGDKIVQAQDYAYTAQGWIKGMNAGRISAAHDIGNDAYADKLFTANSQNRDVGLDAAGFVLGYYDGASGIKEDYWSPAFASQGTAARFVPLVNSAATLADYSSLYNGNISHMITALTKQDQTFEDNQVTAYKYDQLNRIKQVRAHRNFNTTTNAFTGSTGDDGKYHEDFSYDRNGNILNVLRNGNNTGGTQTMDDFTYHYYDNTGTMMIYGSGGWPGNATNKLAYVADVASTSNYTTDIDDQASGTNYEYDDIGNLVSDESEEIDNIDWLANGKIRSITRDAASTKSDLEFVYDAMGNRITKIVKPRNGSGVKSQLHWTYTYYERDAQGNVLAVYERSFRHNAGTSYDDLLTLKELDIYSSKRMGVLYADSTIERPFTDAVFTDANGNVFAPTYSGISPGSPCTDHCVTPSKRTLGKKAYEIANHLGNVLATVSDRKLTVDAYSYTTWSTGTKYKYDAYLNVYYENAGGTFQRTGSSSDNKTDSYTADVTSYSDYYAFGAAMDGRFGGSSYRYDFNGKETDPESDLQDYGMRIYNARLCKFLTVDPLAAEYPWNSTYAFAENDVIRCIDLDGLEKTSPPPTSYKAALTIADFYSTAFNDNNVNNSPAFAGFREYPQWMQEAGKMGFGFTLATLDQVDNLGNLVAWSTWARPSEAEQNRVKHNMASQIQQEGGLSGSILSWNGLMSPTSAVGNGWSAMQANAFDANHRIDYYRATLNTGIAAYGTFELGLATFKACGVRIIHTRAYAGIEMKNFGYGARVTLNYPGLTRNGFGTRPFGISTRLFTGGGTGIGFDFHTLNGYGWRSYVPAAHFHYFVPGKFGEGHHYSPMKFGINVGKEFLGKPNGVGSWSGALRASKLQLKK